MSASSHHTDPEKTAPAAASPPPVEREKSIPASGDQPISLRTTAICGALLIFGGLVAGYSGNQFSYASLFRDAKGRELSDDAKMMVRMLERNLPMPRRAFFERSVLGPSRTQEALREILPSFIFSNDHNAPYALKCLQENKYPPETGKSTTEGRAARHDDSSHIVTAIEYFAVHRKLAHSMDELSEKRKKRKMGNNRGVFDRWRPGQRGGERTPGLT